LASEWSTLQPDKREDLIAAFKMIGVRVRSISIACNDDQCADLAEDLKSIVKVAGWEPKMMVGTPYGVSAGLSLYGPSTETALCDNLGEAIHETTGFPVFTGVTGGDSVMKTPYLLIVGRKPPN